MQRRNFFTAITGILGLVVANKVINSGLSAPSDEDIETATTYTYISKFRSQEEYKAFYGQNVSDNLEKLRAQFFDEGKLLSLKKYSKSTVSTTSPQLHIELIFDSKNSKIAFLQQQQNILAVSKNIIQLSNT